MKLVNWKLDHLAAAIDRGFLRHFDAFDADFFCIHETGVDEDALSLDLPGYEQFWQWASDTAPGAAVFTKHAPIFSEITDSAILLEYQEFFLICGDARTLTEPGKPVIRFDRDGIHIPMELEAQVYRRGNHADMDEPFPVSMDMDLVCNGSILSPTSMGKARILGPDTHEPPAQDAVTVKTKKRNLLLPILCMAAVLFFCTLLLLPKTPKEKAPLVIPEDLVPIQITVLDRMPLSHHTLSTSYVDPSAPCDELTLYSSKQDYTSYITDTYTYSELDRSTFWIQVDLTKDALALDKDGWQLKQEDRVLSSYYPISDLQIICYYADESRTHVQGWFIFGVIKNARSLNLTVSRSDSEYQYFARQDLVPYLILDDIENPFTVTPLLIPPHEGTDDLETDIVEEYTSVSCMYFNYNTYFINNNAQQYRTQDACYWLFVEADDDLVQKIGYNYLELLVSDPNATADGNSIGFTLPSCYALYADPELKERAGWLLYSDNSNVHSLGLTLTWWGYGQQVSHDVTIDIPLYINEEMSKQMTTEELVVSIQQNELFCDSFNHVISFNAPHYPVILELMTRPDAIDTLMNCDVTDYSDTSKEAIRTILLFHEFRALMTPAQEARLLLNDYTSTPYTFDYSNMIEVETDTEGIIELLQEDGMFWSYLGFSDAPEVQRQIYLILRQRNSLLLKLEQCDDAAEVMLEHIQVCESQGCNMNLLYNMWPWIISTTQTT